MLEGTVVESAGSNADDPPYLGGELVADPARLRQRAVFLRELAQARALLARTSVGASDAFGALNGATFRFPRTR
ncbi:hypothetical protein [Haloactinopolyspora sp.]|uniref:hypothetical protein n=1 Tax=Haloactinopolyspora sp. TaxID=1966353 RepID=UPI00260AEB36|nr:hypothetical protein [Haloactinopolyspora sp.]